MYPRIEEMRDKMSNCPYASAIGSLIYAMLCTRPYISHVVSVVSRYQSNPGPEYWTTVKHILKYLKRTRDYSVIYDGHELVVHGYTY